MSKFAELCNKIYAHSERRKLKKYVSGDYKKLAIQPGTHFIMNSDAKIQMDAYLNTNGNCIVRNGRSTMIRMDAGSRLHVKGNFSFFYGADVILFQGSEMILGNSFINSDCKIRCHQHIEIGDDCAISHDVTIMDSDAHYLDGDNHTKPVIIKNHVWIGTRVTILSGVTIGEGAVIAAGSVVNHDIPAGCLAAGSPAKVIKENVNWKE